MALGGRPILDVPTRQSGPMTLTVDPQLMADLESRTRLMLLLAAVLPAERFELDDAHIYVPRCVWDMDQVGHASQTDRLNELLETAYAEWGDEPVIDVFAGPKPKQILVACAFKVTMFHADALLKGIEDVRFAQPYTDAFYNGEVLQLYVPSFGRTEFGTTLDMIVNAVRQCLNVTLYDDPC